MVQNIEVEVIWIYALSHLYVLLKVNPISLAPDELFQIYVNTDGLKGVGKYALKSGLQV